MSIFTQAKSLFKGEDKSYLIVVIDENKERVDLTGFTIEFEVKVAVGDTDPPVIAKSTATTGITIAANQALPADGGNRGEAQLDIDPGDSNAIAARIYKYDLVIIDSASERHVVIPPSDFDVREVVNIAP